MPASLAAAQPIDRIARPKVQRCGLIYGQRRARLPCETKRITFIIDTRPKQREQRAQIVPLLLARARRAQKGKSSLCAPAAAPFKQKRAVHGCEHHRCVLAFRLNQDPVQLQDTWTKAAVAENAPAVAVKLYFAFQAEHIERSAESGEDAGRKAQ